MDINTNINSETDIKTNVPKKKNDIFIKIISVLSAIVIWFFVLELESPNYEKTFESISVKLDNVSLMESEYNFSVISGKNITADIVLSGKKSSINKLKNSDINAYIDLSKVEKAGEAVIIIEVKPINGITVIEINPTYGSVYVDKTASITVPVRADIKQSMTEAGVTLEDPVLSPSTITVTGPEAVLKKISHAQVDLFLGSENRIDKNLTVRETFKLIDTNGEVINNTYLRFSDTNIDVTIPVTKTKTVPLKLNYKHGYYTSQNTQITISPAEIQIKAQPDVLDKIEQIVIGTIDERQIETDTTLRFQIQMPANVTNLSGISTAEVEIKFINTETRTVPLLSDDISVIRPADNLTYNILTDTVQIKLLGPRAALSIITESNLNASIDLSKYLTPGTYTVPLNISGMISSTVFYVGEYTVTVEIEEKPVSSTGGG